ncbi:hypothetical protein [Streptomyces sp. NEAU-YJ-81]|uniref:hypothetical protein n=1 Tax=Streptomyces sp. NEAU-YJ-81 TaxID=2820288 RepID=UPI001ABCB658|nr:hypothetical protein [Streptomyces sp. NEAU-YJ-81]MBO3682758.1 hypothetical protein [Streptomyces sp. NEAU-YJ-81]
MESQISLYKIELIKPRRPWHGLADVELGTRHRLQRFSVLEARAAYDRERDAAAQG